MPTYEYKCSHCAEQIEEIRKFSEREELRPCHKCGEGYFVVQLSVPAPPKFNGVGWARDGYANKPPKP